MRVGVHRLRDVCVSQEFLDYLGIDILRQQERCAGMTEIVKADGAGQTRFLQQGLIATPEEVVPVEGRTDLRGEDEVVVLPEFGEFLSFL
jgi:hypothetical protein